MKVKTHVNELNTVGKSCMITSIIIIIVSILLSLILPVFLLALSVLVVPIIVIFCNIEKRSFADIDKKGELYILRQEGGWDCSTFEYVLAIKRPLCYLRCHGVYFNTIERAMDYIVKLREEEKEKEKERHPCITCVGKEGSI